MTAPTRSPQQPPLATLNSVQRGAVLGALLAGDDAVIGLSMLGGRWNAVCAATHRELLALQTEQRRHLLGAWVRGLRQSELGLLGQLHPSWLVELLRAQHPQVAAALSAVLPRQLATTPELRRFAAPCTLPAELRAQLVTALLVPLAQDAQPLVSLAERFRWTQHPTTRLQAMIEQLGAIVFTESMRRAGVATAERAERDVPPSVGPKLAEARPLAEALRDDAGLAEAIVACSAVLRDLPRIIGAPGARTSAPQRWTTILEALGCGVIAAALPHDVTVALSLRLPRPLGLQLRHATGCGPSSVLVELLERVDGWMQRGPS